MFNAGMTSWLYELFLVSKSVRTVQPMYLTVFQTGGGFRDGLLLCYSLLALMVVVF